MLKSGSDGAAGEKKKSHNVTLWTKRSEQKQKVYHTKHPLKQKTQNMLIFHSSKALSDTSNLQ